MVCEMLAEHYGNVVSKVLILVLMEDGLRESYENNDDYGTL